MSRVLPVRIPDQMFEEIEKLVESGEFKNRNEAATHLLRTGLNPPKAGLEESELRRILREELSRLQIAGAGSSAPVPAHEAKKAKMLASLEA